MSGERGDKRERERRLQEIRREGWERHQAAVDTAAGKDGKKNIPDASGTVGYYGRPLLKAPAWTWEVPTYFFTGGAAGAAAVLAAVGEFSGADPRFVRDAQWLAAIGGGISPALLISDLGMPSRFLNMLRVFKVQSAMSVGSWTLVAFSSSAAAAALLVELERRRPALKVPILTEAAQVVAALTGLVLSTYTGILIGATAIPVWNENVGLLPIHFAASGVGAAVSILELRGHTGKGMNRLGIGAALVETVIGSSFELQRDNPATEPLRTGPTGWTMRTAGLLSGPLPLALRLAAGVAKPTRRAKLRKAAAISTIAGSLVTRWAWVYAGRVSSKDNKVPLKLPGPPQHEVEKIVEDK